MSPSAALQLAPILDADPPQLIAALSIVPAQNRALSDVQEVGITQLVRFAMEHILEVADSLAAKTVELEALQAQANKHVRRCGACYQRRRCLGLIALRQDINRLERKCQGEAERLRRPR